MIHQTDLWAGKRENYDRWLIYASSDKTYTIHLYIPYICIPYTWWRCLNKSVIRTANWYVFFFSKRFIFVKLRNEWHELRNIIKWCKISKLLLWTKIGNKKKNRIRNNDNNKHFGTNAKPTRYISHEYDHK